MAYTGVATDEPVLNTVKLGGTGSSVVRAWGRISQSLTPVSVATVATVEQTFTVPGLQVGDQVTVSPPAINPGVAPVCARVSALNTLAVTFINSTAGALVPTAGVYQIAFVR